MSTMTPLLPVEDDPTTPTPLPHLPRPPLPMLFVAHRSTSAGLPSSISPQIRTAVTSASAPSPMLPPPSPAILHHSPSGSWSPCLSTAHPSASSEPTHRTSSLRDPLPNATPPISRSASPTMAMANMMPVTGREDETVTRSGGRRRVKSRMEGDTPNGEENEYDQIDASPHHRADKRRRIKINGTSPGKRQPQDSPTSPAEPPSSSHSRNGARGSHLAPIKPIGFAASRESRRGGDDEQMLPSPVVMGFDFKRVDEEQLKTVRDTISIKAQQEALIAARRRDYHASNPPTPRELTFKGWQPKELGSATTPVLLAPPQLSSINTAASNTSSSGPTSGGVGRRREKGREKVERMSIVTGGENAGTVVPGSKSAPLGHGLAAQQISPRDGPSGPHTALPPHNLPPMHAGYHQHANGIDPRTAPLASHEFARQQGPYYPSSLHRSRGSFEAAVHRNSLTSGPVPVRQFSGSAAPGAATPSHMPTPITQAQARFPPTTDAGSSALPPRDSFLQPFSGAYDVLAQIDNMRFALQECIARSDASHTAQRQQQAEFKATAQQARELLGTLQQSAESLKEMVRYEVQRARQASEDQERREKDSLRRRITLLEEKLGLMEGEPTSAPDGTGKSAEAGEKRKRAGADGEGQQATVKEGAATSA